MQSLEQHLYLFSRLEWLPFYIDSKIMKCALLFKRIKLEVPQYLIEQLKLNNSVNSRITRFSGLNLVFQNFQGPQLKFKDFPGPGNFFP